MATPDPLTAAQSRDGRGSAALAPTHGPPAPLDGELFDRVIQRIFVAGLLLKDAGNGSTPIAAATSIEQAIGELDEVLRDIRAAAFTALASAHDAGELYPQRDAEPVAELNTGD